MACYSPVKLYERWRDKEGFQEVERSIKPTKQSDYYKDVVVGCGRCIGCKLEKSKEWAGRIMNEASLYENNCYLTLTYDDLTLPHDKRLKKKDLQDFFKRLRYYFSGVDIRYYAVGEYGDLRGRPHYHACVFNLDFPDKIRFKTSKTGYPIYVSEALSKAWKKGHAYLQDLEYGSAAYVARYVMKKQNGPQSRHKQPFVTDLAEYTDLETGEISHFGRGATWYDVPEFAVMSRRPGIGRAWIEKHLSDVYPHDELVINGVKQKPPRYYDNYLAQTNRQLYDAITEKRLAESHDENRLANRTADRLRTREDIQRRKAAKLRREYEGS